MTPTTPKSPVDTIREASDVLRRSLADPEGVTFHVRHGGDCRAWFQEPCSCSAQERFSEIMSALSALSTQPAQTEGLEEPDHICDLLMELHGEFYGKGKAHADAFRAIPKVVDFIKSRSLPRQKGEVDMETVIDIRAAIIELMGTGVKVPTTEELIAYMATSPSNSNP